MATDMQVANTILAQLGGQRFIAMTGANSFTGDTNRLIFALPRNPSRINKIEITLNGSDLYDIAGYSIRGTTVRKISGRLMVSAENLCAAFTSLTGLDTRL